MSEKFSSAAYISFKRRKFIFLFIFLLIPYLLHPVVDTDLWGITLLDISLSALFVIGVLAISSRVRIAAVALVLLVLCQVLTWTTHEFSDQVLISFGLALNAVFLIFIAAIILSYVIKSRSVTGQTIFAALCVYLLIALIWAFLYSFLEDLYPNSFKINYELFQYQAHGRHLFSKLYYFMYLSFTTMTALGLGDILPASSWARILMSLESVAGQLYLVVVVSSLVGLRVTQVFQTEIRELERERKVESALKK